MAGGSMLTFFHLVMIHHSVSFPQWVYRVDSCPDPKNISQWIEASKKLNCYHNLTSNNPTEQERIYHCLPSSFLNETLEFCSRSVLINSVPMCLNLRPKLRCFVAEKKCMSNATYSTGKSNGGKLATFLIYICLILLILVVVGIILYKCFNQRCQASKTCHNPINTLQYQSINCSTATEREKDPLLSSNELTSEAKLSDPLLLQHCLYSKWENSKINFCRGNTRDNLEYIEITTSNRVENDQENDPLLSTNESTSDLKLNDFPLLQPCLYSKWKNSKINFCGGNTRDNLDYIEKATLNLVENDQENDPLLSSNESTSEVKLSDLPLLQPFLYSKWENSKINLYGGNSRDSMEYIEIETTNLVENDQKNDQLFSSNELSSEAKSSDPPLLQHCLYSKRENSKIISCGGNAREYLEYIELTTCNLVNRDLKKDPLLSSNVLISEAKLGDPPLLQPGLYSKHEHLKINFCGGNTRDNLECIVISTDLENDIVIVGYACITNTAVTLNEMVETPIATCNFSRVWNRLVEIEGSINDKKRTGTDTSMRVTKHRKFDMILIIMMENNDCRGKIPKRFFKIWFRESKKNREMLCNKFEERILHQKKSFLALALRKKDLIDQSVTRI